MAKAVLLKPAAEERDFIREFVARHHPEWLSEYDVKFNKNQSKEV